MRNLDGLDWLGIMRETLDTNDCDAATIQGGYPTKNEWSWEPFGRYQLFRCISTRHFMMKRERFDRINWNEIVDLTLHDTFAGLGSWEAWFNNRLTPVKTLGYSTNHLGMWHIGAFSIDKLHRVCHTDEVIPHDIG